MQHSYLQSLQFFKLLDYVSDEDNDVTSDGQDSINSDNISVSLSDICQLDGNVSFYENQQSEGGCNNIPVFISQNRRQPLREERQPVRKAIKRNNLVLQSMVLPTVMNVNPCSLYQKYEEFSTIVDQYSAEVITVSESWEQEHT